jgi:hypothetical protein
MTIAKQEPLSFCEGNTAFYIPLAAGSERFCATGGRPSGACYVRAAVPSRGPLLRGATAATVAVALALAGCGDSDDGGDEEQAASYRVAVPDASFPARQRLAEHVELRITVRNTGTRTIPNVAATLATGGRGNAAADAFASTLADEEGGLSSRSRPVWIVEEGPGGGDTAYANTWAIGSIAPHATRTFRWNVVPVKAGRYTLRYKLVGSTSGRSQLRLANGEAPDGSFTVRVTEKPAKIRITRDGRIVTEPGT